MKNPQRIKEKIHKEIAQKILNLPIEMEKAIEIYGELYTVK